MKTTKLTSSIVTLSLVIFMSFTSIANSGTSYSGDLIKSGDKSTNTASVSDKEYSYLRFDVNNFINESDATELPAANEFEYLRFDVNNFTENNSESMAELPVNELDYLRFDVSRFTANVKGVIDELPIKE